ncbi:AAA family ATPase [Fervidibacillus albus]|uniref:AAA family ATPase n=1 Tax=Fervidibacillus albus TaxID=2980026 RepID=A0A9E8LWC4_9BACI|nr:AAA family ATPase [Fervidibacillus albus]WAA10918.1 AAA family ATPase [Fervidibacillus albus]
MIIRKVNVQSVLHYDQFELDLGDQMALHILYGPNEAGKSTLLNLMIDGLFGGKIEGNRKDYFDTRSKLEFILEHPSLPPIHYFRKKRYSKFILVDENGKEMENERLTPYLSGFEKEQFALLFGFDHERLRSGGESLLQSGGHVGISLFESGGGIQYVQKIVNLLNDRTKELIDPSFRKGSSKLLNKSWHLYTRSIADMREKGLRGEDWHKKAKEIDEKKDELDRLQKKYEQIQLDLTKERRRQRIWKPYQDRQKIRLQLDSLQQIPILSDETVQRISDTIENYVRTKEEKAKIKSKYEQKKTIRDQIHYDHQMLSLGTEIYTMNEKLQQYISRKMKEIPEEIRSMDEWKIEAQSLLLTIAPSIRIEEAEQLRIPFSEEEAILALADEVKNIQLGLQSEKERLQEYENERTKLERELKEMEVPVDPAPFEQLIRRIQREGNLDAQIKETKREWELGKERIDRIQKDQNIWGGSLRQLSEIPIPLIETIETYEKRWDELEKERVGTEQAITEEQERYYETINQLEQIELGGYVPVEADLQNVRNRRNEHWTFVKSVWLGKENVETISKNFSDADSLAALFEQSISEADHLVDVMRKESDRSAKRANLLLQKKQTEEKIDRLKEKLAETKHRFASLTKEWNEEWKRAGIQPKSPAEMKEWLKVFYRPVLEEWKKVKDVEKRYDTLSNIKSTLFEELTVAAQSIGCEVASSNNSIETILRSIETYVKKAEEKRINLENYKKRLKDANLKQLIQKQKVEQLNDRLEKAEERWEAIREKYGHLGSNPEIARTTIEKLRKLFQILSNITRAERSVQRKKEECDAFEWQVADLAKRLSKNISDYPSIENFVRTLRETYEREREKKTTADAIRKQVQEIEMEIVENERQERELKEIVQNYMETYQCGSVEDLRTFLLQASEKKDLETKWKETEERLMEAGDFLPLEQLEREAEAIENPEMIPSRIEQLEEKSQIIESRIKDEKEPLWHLKREFETMNETKTDVVFHSQNAESYLAEVDQYWNEYVRIELAKRLLQRAIEEYRRKNETTIIHRASNFFQKLTLNQYEQLIIDYDGDIPIIVAIDRKKGKRTVREMSDGTRDQLYLSLRLAFVENHLNDSVPVPLIMDDIFVHFDDERTKATLEILHQFATKTQILYFTHHQYVVQTARTIGENVQIHHIGNTQMEPVEGSIQ